MSYDNVYSESFTVVFFFYKVIYFLAALGVRCYVRAFSSCGERGLLFVAVASLCFGVRALGAWASVVVARGPSNCGARA